MATPVMAQQDFLDTLTERQIMDDTGRALALHRTADREEMPTFLYSLHSTPSRPLRMYGAKHNPTIWL